MNNTTKSNSKSDSLIWYLWARFFLLFLLIVVTAIPNPEQEELHRLEIQLHSITLHRQVRAKEISELKRDINDLQTHIRQIQEDIDTMAITPQQAQTLTRQQETDLKRWEESIDRSLQGMSPGEKRKVKAPTGYSDLMYNRLKALYTGAGWNVIKTKMQEYVDRPGVGMGGYAEVDAWEFSAASSDASWYDH